MMSRGTLSSPRNGPVETSEHYRDDAEQNMRLTFLEKQIGKHEELLEEFRYGGAK